MKLHPLLAILFTVSLCGCAATPAPIPPTFVPKSQYAGTDCNELRAELQAKHERPQALMKKQSGLRQRDIVANILLTPELGTADTNHMLWNDIALSKGKIVAINAELSTRCEEAKT